jgi:hypothetical protein
VTWRDLKPLDGWYELERPEVSEENGSALAGFPHGGHIALDFNDPQSREWFAEWLRSKRGWTAFMAWVDEKR